jgi:hypothetical protein
LVAFLSLQVRNPGFLRADIDVTKAALDSELELRHHFVEAEVCLAGRNPSGSIH